MAVHKVPQDVEAEDKFFGPLSFKQFVFFGGVLVCLFLMYQTFSYNVPYLSIFVLPFFIVCVTLAFPWTKDQPTELWLASRIRFLLVPRRRIWDQEGIEDRVTVTVPKREVHIYSDGLDQTQVKSRLSALANIVDSKGWAAADKDVHADYHSDRLVNGGQYVNDPLHQHDTADILDDITSPLAQQFGTMIAESAERRKQDAQDMMQSFHPSQAPKSATAGQPASSPWFLQQQPIEPNTGIDKLKQTKQIDPVRDEQDFLDKIRKKEAQEAKANAGKHMKRIKRAGDSGETLVPQAGAAQPQQQTAYAPSPTSNDPAIMALAQRDDLNVSTIARQANIYNVTDDDEVVVSLHK